MNKRIRTNARGEIDRTGMILQALSNSLLKSVSGDPRDPASTRGSTLLRIADGLNDGTVSINEAEAAMKKLERVDAELEIKDLEKVTKIEQGKTTSLGSLPAKLRALAVAKAKQAGIDQKTLSEIAKNKAAAFESYTKGLVEIEKETGAEFSNSIVGGAQGALQQSEKGKAISAALENINDEGAKEFSRRTYQEFIRMLSANDPQASIVKASVVVANQFNDTGKLAPDFWARNF